MKRLKIKNISNLRLDFFLLQNSQDIKVTLDTGQETWCDVNSNTKSMILYERKNLIQITEEEITQAVIFTETLEHKDPVDLEVLESMTPMDQMRTLIDKYSKDLEIEEDECVKQLPAEPDKEFNEQVLETIKPTGDYEDIKNYIQQDLKQEEPLIEIIDEVKLEKNYKGKKRGRKKKRGPKPGAKKKKLKEFLKETANTIIYSGQTSNDIQGI